MDMPPSPSPSPSPTAHQMLRLSVALFALRDACTLAAWALRDLQTEQPSPQRDASLAATRDYLRRLHTAARPHDGHTPAP